MGLRSAWHSSNFLLTSPQQEVLEWVKLRWTTRRTREHARSCHYACTQGFQGSWLRGSLLENLPGYGARGFHAYNVHTQCEACAKQKTPTEHPQRVSRL